MGYPQIYQHTHNGGSLSREENEVKMNIWEIMAKNLTKFDEKHKYTQPRSLTNPK